MKIGILTQPLGHNYGGILQNFALQKFLESMGLGVLTLSYFGRPQNVYIEVRDTVTYLIKHAIFHPTRKENKLPTDNPNLHLLRFTWRKLKITSETPNAETANKYNLDCFIVGSDQVWRPIYNGSRLPLMFGAFLPDSCGIPVVAYAASFGVGEWEYSPEQTEMARREIRRFKAVSVREASGVDLCREYLGVEAKHVLDPTLLLGPSDYMKLVPQKTLSKTPKGCVGVYILDITEEKRKIVETVCRTLGKRAVYFGCRPEGKTKMPSVESWLAHFANSSFIITDSFHGTAFSINFQRPFLSIVNPDRGADRFTSLLDSVGLSNLLISETTAPEAIEALAKTSINWLAVSTRLSNLRAEARDFLEKSLRK